MEAHPPFSAWAVRCCKPLMLFHVLLLLCGSLQLLYDNGSEGGYFRATKRAFFHWFVLPNPAVDFDTVAHSVALYDVKTTVKALQFALDGYEKMTVEAVDGFFHTGASPSLTLVQYKRQTNMFDKDSKFVRELVSTTFDNVNASYLGSLSTGNAREEIMHAVDIKLTLEVISWASLVRRSCLIWRVDLDFAFSTRGHISLTLNPVVKGDCDPKLNTLEDVFTWEDWLWMNLLIIAFALAYVYYAVNGDGLRLGWTYFNILACLGLIIHAFINLSTNQARKPTSWVQVMFSGAGVGTLWVSLTRYLPGYGYGTLKLTIERSFPKIVRFLVGCLPTFLAFAMFGLVAFGGSSTKFATLKDAVITLFSLFNGDAIRDTFSELVVLNPVVAQLCTFFPLGRFCAATRHSRHVCQDLYSFVLLFSYIVLNLVLAIVEEAFFNLSLASSQGNTAEPPSLPSSSWYARFLQSSIPPSAAAVTAAAAADLENDEASQHLLRGNEAAEGL